MSRREYDNEDQVVDDTLERRRFRTLDRNDDARLARNEAQMSGVEFDRADVNNNRYLSMAEFLNWNNTATGIGSFDTLDRNNDGVISWDEWRARARPRQLRPAGPQRRPRGDPRGVREPGRGVLRQ